jgi:hypothetical protein
VIVPAEFSVMTPPFMVSRMLVPSAKLPAIVVSVRSPAELIVPAAARV